MGTKTANNNECNECLDCENYKRKIKENEQTVSARDVLIDMLQTELKKKENAFRTAIDEHEKLRYIHCSIVQDYTNLKEIHKKLIEENKRLIEEKRELQLKLKELEDSRQTVDGDSNQSKEVWPEKEGNSMRTVQDGITNIQNIMQCQNRSLKSVLLQLLDELKKSRTESPTERDITENSKSPNDNCKCDSENKDEAYLSSIDCLQKQLENLNLVVEKLRKENKKIKENLYEKQASLANCLTVLENNNADIDNLSDHVEGLCRERDKYREEATALQIELVTKEGEICQLKIENKTIDNLREDIEKLTCENCCLKNSIQKLQSEIEEKSQQLLICLEEKDKLEQIATELESDKTNLETNMQNLFSENCSLQLCIEEYKCDYQEKSKQLELCCNEKSELEKKALEFQTLYENLQISYNENQQRFNEYKNEVKESFEKQENEFNEYRMELLNTIDGLKSELQAKQTKVTNTISQCDSACLSEHSTQFIEEIIETKTQCIEACIASSNQITQTISEEPIKSLEEYETEIKSLEEEFLCCKCLYEEQLQSLEEENNKLKENLSNIKTRNSLEEKQYNECKCVFENKLQELDQENDNLRTQNNKADIKLSEIQNELEQCKCRLENKIQRLQTENGELVESLENLTSESKSNLKKLEQNYCVCKSALEHKIKQLEEDNKHLKETLELIAGDNQTNKNEEDFYACKCIMENKIKNLERENINLKDTITKITKEYDLKIETMEREFHYSKINLENKIKSLEEEKNILKKNHNKLEETTSNQKKTLDDFESCKCILEHRIRVLESENQILTDTLTRERIECENLINKSSDDYINLQNLLNERILQLIQENKRLETAIEEQTENKDNVIDAEEYYECRCALETKIKILQQEKQDLQETLSILTSENRSNLNKINELSRALKTVNNQMEKTTTETEEDINEKSNILKENEALKEEINKLEKKLLNFQNEIDAANLELTEYEEENRCYSQKLETLTVEIQNLEEAKLRIEEDNAEYNQRMNKLRQEFNAITEAKDKSINELNEKINELEDHATKPSVKLEELIKINEELKNKLTFNEKIVEDLQTENSKLMKLEETEKSKDQQLILCCDQLKSIKEELNEYINKCNQLECKVKALENNKFSLEEKIFTMESIIEEMTKESEDLKQLIIELEKGREELKPPNEELIQQIQHFEEQLKFKQDIINSLEDCIDRSNTILENCEAEMRTVQEDNEKLYNELEKKVRELEEVKQKQSCRVLKNQIELLSAENSQLKQILDSNNLEEINREMINKYHKLEAEKNKELENLTQFVLDLSDTEVKTVSKTGKYKSKQDSKNPVLKPCECVNKKQKKSSDTTLQKTLKNSPTKKEPLTVAQYLNASKIPKPSPTRNRISSIRSYSDTRGTVSDKPCGCKTQKETTGNNSPRKQIALCSNSQPAFSGKNKMKSEEGHFRVPNQPQENLRVCPCPKKAKIGSIVISDLNIKSQGGKICPKLATPCTDKRGSQSEIAPLTELQLSQDKKNCPKLGTPCPRRIKLDPNQTQETDSSCCPQRSRTKNLSNQRQSRTNSLELTRKVDTKICPCPGIRSKSSDSSNQNLSKSPSINENESENSTKVCPTLGKPCLRSTSSKNLEADILNRLSKLELQLKKPVDNDVNTKLELKTCKCLKSGSTTSNTKKECRCNSNSKLGSQTIIKKISEEKKISQTLGIPCPEQKSIQDNLIKKPRTESQGSINKQGSRSKEDNICPTLGIPCPGNTVVQNIQLTQKKCCPHLQITTPSTKICPRLGIPCPNGAKIKSKIDVTKTNSDIHSTSARNESTATDTNKLTVDVTETGIPDNPQFDKELDTNLDLLTSNTDNDLCSIKHDSSISNLVKKSSSTEKDLTTQRKDSDIVRGVKGSDSDSIQKHSSNNSITISKNGSNCNQNRPIRTSKEKICPQLCEESPSLVSTKIKGLSKEKSDTIMCPVLRITCPGIINQNFHSDSDEEMCCLNRRRSDSRSKNSLSSNIGVICQANCNISGSRLLKKHLRSSSADNRMMKNTGSDPIQEIIESSQVNKTNCNCMSVIKRQYEIKHAIEPTEIYDLVEMNDAKIPPSHSSCNSLVKNDTPTFDSKALSSTSQSEQSCCLETIEKTYSYEQYPCSFEVVETDIEIIEKLELCECVDTSSNSDITS